VRPDLPTGTITFVFTDVEGSASADHRAVIREACIRNGGVEVDTQGDAFSFAFPIAPGGSWEDDLRGDGKCGPIFPSKLRACAQLQRQRQRKMTATWYSMTSPVSGWS
jgi:hypothetical protein